MADLAAGAETALLVERPVMAQDSRVQAVGEGSPVRAVLPHDIWHRYWDECGECSTRLRCCQGLVGPMQRSKTARGQSVLHSRLKNNTRNHIFKHVDPPLSV